MAKSSSKQTKKFVQSGGLARSIKDRKRKQDVKKKIDNRRALRGKPSSQHTERDSDEEEIGNTSGAAAAPARDDAADSEDDMFNEETLQGLLGSSDDEQEDSHASEDQVSKGEDSLADLEGEEEKHRLDIAALRQKDPEFYKYLEENDRGLLEFGDDNDERDPDADQARGGEQKGTLSKSAKKGNKKAIEPKVTTITQDLLKSWQKQMLQQRSLKALRKVLLCFRSAARAQADEDDSKTVRSPVEDQYIIPNAMLFNKVITTALKYTPLVLAYHVPYKEMSNGKYKVPTQSKKYATAQRIIKSYFVSLHSLLSTLSSNTELLQLSITESSRLIPYLVGNRKASKDYLRSMLEYWTTGRDDSVRLASFLGLRRMAVAGEQSLSELVLKGSYLAVQQSSKTTTAFTLPSINLMKNTASTLYLLNPTQAYQIAFRYIRQLAITLRNAMKLAAKSMKDTNKEKYRQVYNWQFVHAVDFWSLVLATACDTAKETESAVESELRHLIYPLVQITLGAIRLVPTSRYYPLRFQLITSLLRIVQRTGTYIPLAPYLIEILDSSELSRKPKGSSLKPLDWTYYIRAPASYPHTRVYVDGIIDEIVYLLLEFFATQSTSIAFPELTIPILIALKRHIKKTKNPRLSGSLKTLVERLESNSQWIEEKRDHVEFSPQDREQVDAFLLGEESSPLRTYLKLQRKIREQRRELLEKSLVADGDGRDDDDDEGADDIDEEV